MQLKRILALSIAGVMTVSALTGCGAGSDQKKSAETTASTAAKADGTVDIELWTTNNGFKEIEKGSPAYNFYKEKLGVGIIQPYVEWNGGTTYLQQLQLKIAANEAPDIFIPQGGIEKDLAKNGAILDLTELLPQKAPDFWKLVPKEAWDVMKTYDPNGQGRIFMTPNSTDYAMDGGLIRKDWLDKLGLSMPKTQDEFVKVLEAFRDKDPNGNGQKDEIPTGGRQNLSWMDHLFSMYGVSTYEGTPQWDIYNGQLTYAAVTPNMKDCLAWLSKLYAQGLLDKETLLNDKSKWDGKVNSNRVGVFHRILQEMNMYPEAIEKNTGVKAEFVALPAIDAPGYKSFYTKLAVKGPQYVIKNQKDQKKVDACFKYLNAIANKDTWYDLYLGVKDMHYVEKDGKKVKLPDDKTKQQNLAVTPYNETLSIDFYTQLLNRTAQDAPERKWALDQSIRTLKDIQQYAKSVAGDGIPSLIYTNYPDIQNRTLYIEYASKIIVGEYPISKFDEFVDRWNKSGGEAVTKAARDWHSKIRK